MSSIQLSVILPARNEEKLIRTTLIDILHYLRNKRYQYEILIIINGSSDLTEKIAADFAVKHPQIKIYKSHPGYGYALKKGLQKSLGQYILVYNVDFYDTHLIDLVDIDMYGKDMIIGSKRTHWSEDNRPLVRKVVSTIFNFYLTLFHDFKGSDTHGIKLMSRKLLNSCLLKCQLTNGLFDTELVLRSQHMGFQIADFPVKVSETRPSRFNNRLLQTPIDIMKLNQALRKGSLKK